MRPIAPRLTRHAALLRLVGRSPPRCRALSGTPIAAHLGASNCRFQIEGIGHGGKAREETLEIRSLNNARTVRARKGKAADLGFKPIAIVRVE